MVKIALIYDFDKTLCTKDMQEYSLIPSLGYDNAKDFWKEVTDLTKSNHMDAISSYLYVLHKKFKEQGNPLRKSMFTDLGKDIVLFPGVETWFSRINAIGKELGLEVEHYIISSGMHEIIDGTTIAKEFKKIYACQYYYEDDYAIWPAQIVNYTTKTQYIFRINKQILDENDDVELNRYVDLKDRPVPFSRMIYIADGITDVPCMRLVKEYHGKSIAVYNEENEKSKDIAKELLKDGRVNFAIKANYEEGSDMEKVVRDILVHMKADSVLKELEGSMQ